MVESMDEVNNWMVKIMDETNSLNVQIKMAS